MAARSRSAPPRARGPVAGSSARAPATALSTPATQARTPAQHPAQCQVRVDPLHQPQQPQLLKPPNLSLQTIHPRQMPQRRAPPQPQRLPQPPRRLSRLTGSQQTAPLTQQPLKHRRVQLPRPCPQHIPTRTRLQDPALLLAVALQHPTQPRHRHLHCIHRALPPPLPKQQLHQLLHRHQLIPSHQQQRQQHPLALTSQSNRLTPAEASKAPSTPNCHRPATTIPITAMIRPPSTQRNHRHPGL